MNLVWFRTDLRLADNPALYHAVKSGEPTLALFVLFSDQHKLHGESAQKYEFMKAHINDLVVRLAQLGIPSTTHEVSWFKDAAPFMGQLVKKHKIKHVYINANYWPNERKRDQAVKRQLKESQVQLSEYHSNYLLAPGTVRKADGSMYHVFTPYKKKYIEHLKQTYRIPLAVPTVSDIRAVEVPLSLNVNFNLNQWPIGESALAKRLKPFLKEVDYHEQRDFPAIKGTSRLSPYLATGVISAQQCLAYALKYQGETAFNSTWVAELIWRDFYNDLMYEYPHLAKHQTFKAQAKDQWLDKPALFQQWQQGQTGFPIVDAGMRQLLKEGWMHNRVRMIVASFLCKLCLVDWRLGEAHFMKHLLDGDLASNNGGWQWSSATGCDAAPYFRIFNPTTQSQKFDPSGAYIKTFVPELNGLSAKEIHSPHVNIRKKLQYPEPMIDYKVARVRALEWFKKPND